MHAITNLDQYLAKYGNLLGKQVHDALEPLHIPGRDPAVLPKFLRDPFPPQAHVAQALVKGFKRQKSQILVGEMGTGKTLMGMVAFHTVANGKPYRAIVFCPGQLVNKWQREIQMTVPGATVTQITSYKDLLKIRQRGKATGPEWYVIPRDRAKLGAKWKPAYVKHGKQLRCPTCGGALGKYTDGELTTAWEQDHLHKDKRKCPAPYNRDEHKFDASCKPCGAPLWNYTSELNRIEPAKYIHKHMRYFFDYLILDEAHEEKSADSAQANAAGSLIASVRKALAMTGTLIGGSAEHIRPLLFRLSPQSLVAEGLGWSDAMAFSERYGRIETRVTTKEGGGRGNKQSRGSSSKTRSVRPGIMPPLFGRHLLGNTVFLGLNEVASRLPQLEERVISVKMDAEQKKEYDRIEKVLRDQIKEMVRKGDKRLLGTMLQTLLCWPDHPFGWDTVGYSDKGSFIPVVEPENLSAVMRPKEAKLIELVKAERKEGHQVWVYANFTDAHDVLARLEKLMVAEGLSAKVLRSTVPLVKREEWIAKNAPGTDVIISHPKLVETGLDFFDKDKTYNMSTLIFYETGYNLFTLRQAARRAWRIGQPNACKVLYLYYQDTLQDKAMALMGKKMTAAAALEGKFSSEGLAAMAGEDGTVEMALARSLSENFDEDGSRAWEKIGGITKPGIGATVAALTAIAARLRLARKSA